MIKYYKWEISLILFSFLIHLTYLSTGYVNYEYTFELALRALLELPHINERLFNHYFRVQANPLGYPAILSVFQHAFSFEIDEFSVRSLSLVGGVLLLFSSISLYNSFFSEAKEKRMIFISALSLAPIIWIYSGRATADILPTGLFYLSLHFLRFNNKFTFLASSLIFSLAVLVKFHVALLGLAPLFVICGLGGGQVNKNFLRKAAVYHLAPVICLIIYLFVIKYNFDFFVLPERFKSIHGFTVSGFFKSFYQYFSYLSFLLGPLAFLVLLDKKNFSVRKVLLISMLVGLTFSCLPSVHGEMSYGLFSRLFSSQFMKVIELAFFMLSAVIFYSLFQSAFKDKNLSAKNVLLVIVPFVLVLCFSRPAQRYLIFILPFYMMVVLELFGKEMGKLYKGLLALYFCYCISVNVLTVFWQVSNGRACLRVYKWLEAKNYVAMTRPSEIRHCLAHKFIESEENDEKLYIVRVGSSKKPLYKEDVTLFGKVLKTYEVVDYLGEGKE